MSTLLKDRHTLRYGVPNEDGATPTARGERQDLPVIIPSSSNSSSSSSLALPSSSSTIPSLSHRNNATRRFAMLPATELDLRSLPPTPQETYSSPLSAVNEDAPPLPSISAPTLLPDHQQAPPPPPTPPPPPPVPKSSGPPSPANGPFPFPTVRGTGGHKRKTSTASQISQAQSQAQYSRNSYASTTSNFSSSSAGGSSMPPSVPARSPLRRPSAKSTASFSGILKEFDLAPNSPLPLSPTSLYSTTTHGGPNSNYASFGAGGGATVRPSPDRPLPRRPSDASESGGSLSSETMMNPNPSFTSFAPTLTPDNASILTATIPSEEKRNNKRKNALLELLSSERAYAADLALVRDIHIPLSKGLPTPFDPTSHSGSLPTLASSAQSQNQVSPRSSTHTASSAQTHSSVSTALTSVSGGSTGAVNPADLPMPPETSKVVFGNIDEIAVFADRFSEQLEDALGDVIPGAVGEDRVGKLFLEMIPLMGPLYKAYITKHPTANTQWQSLQPCPALTQYNAQCRKLVAAHSNAWDVPSFLIKPVQRLLKYPLLLGSIYNETPDDHPDKQNLIDAKVKIEEVARMVNEGRRRWEVVKTVLNGTGKANSAVNGAGTIAPRAGAPKMTRMRSFRTKIRPNGETIDVERDRIELDQWEKRIKECEGVVKDVAKQTLEWNQSLETVLKRLKNWNAGFGRVTGLGEAGVEAVGAFGKVIQGLQVLSYEFNKTVQTVYLPQLSLLLRTLSSPRILLAHIHTLRHSHVALLNTPYKTRPPSSLVEASNDYRALRDTLQEELPTFIRLFEKGLAVLLLEFAEWQMRLWREVKERWTSFWIALALEGEGDENVAGIGSNAAETIKIWKERFCEVEEILVGFRTLKPPAKSSSRPSAPGSIYRQPNGSEASVMDPYGRALYQQGSRSLSAHDLMNNPITEEAVTWEAVERELAHRSMTSTPSVHSHHRRGNNSAKADSQLAHLMANTMIPGPAFIPSSKDKKKPRESREPPRSSINNRDRESREPPRSSINNRDTRESREPPRSSNSNRDTRDTRGRTEAPVPRVVEPYTQDRGVGMALARATSPKPNNPPVSPRDKKKAKEKEKHRSRELDDSASIRGDAGSLRATSPRPFRRKLTDTLFGSPRSPSHSRTRSQQSNTLSEPDPDWKGSRRSSNTSSLEPPSAHSRNAFSPLPPLRVSGTSFASEVPVPFQLDPPPSPLYACTTVCPFKHDRSVTYMSLPMLDLDIGDTIQVLYEAGHPREHALPGYVDEGDDCLLAAREESTGRIGWVLASYVIPIQ